ncbi:MAG: 30S ribosomal protein S12 methylthiotransferase RimO [Clostridia bacterium]|nr:30S ribosomal protein S12 methylthiotransferase RimO [Clostridia bacterium]
MKVGLVSLGCDKIRVDAEVMLGTLVKNGYEITNDETQADIIIVNTCGFINAAKKESIDTILEMAEYKKQNCKYLIASGCLSERYLDELAEEIPEVDAFIGVGDYHRIDEVLNELKGKSRVLHESKSMPYNAFDRVITTPLHYAYLKIAEGCNHKCSFCAIPLIKGPYKSGDFEQIVEEAKRLVNGGVKELILVAQDTTKFGMDKGELMLARLIDELCKIDDLKWLRILYAYPECVTDEIIDAMERNEKVCKYLDIPVQHISDKILKTMGRATNKKQVTELFKKLHNKGFTLRSTLIVGFPTETDEDFAELCEFVEAANIERLGVFAYSREENTPAAKMEQVDEEVKEQRLDTIMSIQKSVSERLCKSRIGKTYQVLLEGIEDGIYYGRSYMEAPEIDGKVYVEGMDLKIGEFYNAKITQAAEYDVYGVEV